MTQPEGETWIWFIREVIASGLIFLGLLTMIPGASLTTFGEWIHEQ